MPRPTPTHHIVIREETTRVHDTYWDVFESPLESAWSFYVTSYKYNVNPNRIPISITLDGHTFAVKELEEYGRIRNGH